MDAPGTLRIRSAWLVDPEVFEVLRAYRSDVVGNLEDVFLAPLGGHHDLLEPVVARRRCCRRRRGARLAVGRDGRRRHDQRKVYGRPEDAVSHRFRRMHIGHLPRVEIERLIRDRPAGQLERPQPVEKLGTPSAVWREREPAVPETLQRLPESVHAALPDPPHERAVEVHRDDFARAAGLVDHRAVRADDDRLPDAIAAGSVDADEIQLVGGRVAARDRKLDVAVDGVGHGRADDYFGPHPRERAHRLRKPHVVADAQPDAAGSGHVENRKAVAGADALLVRTERKLLAVAQHDRAVRIDDGSGVVDVSAVPLEHRARDQPDPVAARSVPESILDVAGQRNRERRQRAGHVQLAEHDHLHPGKAPRRPVDLVQQQLDVVFARQLQLQRGDGEMGHALLRCIVDAI